MCWCKAAAHSLSLEHMNGHPATSQNAFTGTDQYLHTDSMAQLFANQETRHRPQLNGTDQSALRPPEM